MSSELFLWVPTGGGRTMDWILLGSGESNKVVGFQQPLSAICLQPHLALGRKSPVIKIIRRV